MEIQSMNEETAFLNAVKLLLKIYVDNFYFVCNIMEAYERKDYDFIHRILLSTYDNIYEYSKKI